MARVTLVAPKWQSELAMETTDVLTNTPILRAICECLEVPKHRFEDDIKMNLSVSGVGRDVDWTDLAQDKDVADACESDKVSSGSTK
jgi:hypothetical protein